MKVEKICQCGNHFLLIPSKATRAKFCSSVCKYKFYVKATGFKRVEKGPNSSFFKKGNKPWNTGTKGIKPGNSGSIKKGEHRGISTQFKNGHTFRVPREKFPKGESHRFWKGDDVGYMALHTWVRRHKGNPEQCEHCGLIGSSRKIQWANKSHQYKRDLNDWIALCGQCHRKHDKPARGAIKNKFPMEGRLCVV